MVGIEEVGTTLPLGIDPDAQRVINVISLTEMVSSNARDFSTPLSDLWHDILRLYKPENKIQELINSLGERTLLAAVHTNSDLSDNGAESDTGNGAEELEIATKLLAALFTLLTHELHNEEEIKNGILYYLPKITSLLESHFDKHDLNNDEHDLFVAYSIQNILFVFLHLALKEPEIEAMMDTACVGFYNAVSDWAPAPMCRNDDKEQVEAWESLAEYLVTLATRFPEYVGLSVVTVLYAKKVMGPAERMYYFLPTVLKILAKLKVQNETKISVFCDKIGKTPEFTVNADTTTLTYLYKVLIADQENVPVVQDVTEASLGPINQVFYAISALGLPLLPLSQNINMILTTIITTLQPRIHHTPEALSNALINELATAVNLYRKTSIHMTLSLDGWRNGDNTNTIFYSETSLILYKLLLEIAETIKKLKAQLSKSSAEKLSRSFMTLLEVLRVGFDMPALSWISIDFTIDSDSKAERLFLEEVLKNIICLPRTAHKNFYEEERKKIVKRIQEAIRGGKLENSGILIVALYSLLDLALVNNKGDTGAFSDEYRYFQEFLGLLKKNGHVETILPEILLSMLFSSNLYSDFSLYQQARATTAYNLVRKMVKEINPDLIIHQNPVFYSIKMLEAVKDGNRVSKRVVSHFERLLIVLANRKDAHFGEKKVAERAFLNTLIEEFSTALAKGLDARAFTEELAIIKFVCSKLVGNDITKKYGVVSFALNLLRYCQTRKDHTEKLATRIRQMEKYSSLSVFHLTEILGANDYASPLEDDAFARLIRRLSAEKVENFYETIMEFVLTDLDSSMQKGSIDTAYRKLFLFLLDNNMTEMIRVILSSEDFMNEERENIINILFEIVVGCNDVRVLSCYMDYLNKWLGKDVKRILDVQDYMGYTAWQYAVSQGKHQMAALLKRYGASTSIPDNYGRTFDELQKRKPGHNPPLFTDKAITELAVLKFITAGFRWMINPIFYCYTRLAYLNSTGENPNTTIQELSVLITRLMLPETLALDENLKVFIQPVAGKFSPSTRVFSLSLNDGEPLEVKTGWISAFIREVLKGPHPENETLLVNIRDTFIVGLLASFYTEKPKPAVEQMKDLIKPEEAAVKPDTPVVAITEEPITSPPEIVASRHSMSTDTRIVPVNKQKPKVRNADANAGAGAGSKRTGVHRVRSRAAPTTYTQKPAAAQPAVVLQESIPPSNTTEAIIVSVKETVSPAVVISGFSPRSQPLPELDFGTATTVAEGGSESSGPETYLSDSTSDGSPVRTHTDLSDSASDGGPVRTDTKKPVLTAFCSSAEPPSENDALDELLRNLKRVLSTEAVSNMIGARILFELERLMSQPVEVTAPPPSDLRATAPEFFPLRKPSRP